MASSAALPPILDFDLGVQTHDSFLLNSKILKPLDDVLRCHICFDYFTNCMITKCSHNYCSVCIRRYMAYKSKCPTCFKDASEPELQNNRLIDEILRVYKNVRETLQIPSETFKTEPSVEQPSSSQPYTAKDSLSQSYTEKKLEKAMTTKESSCHRSDSKISMLIQDNTVSDEVSCPVCYNTVSNERINIHLDTCLKQTQERSQRKFLPKLVYHLLSDKDIRKKLKEHGLSTSGNRSTLIKRLKNFIILYNANCDSLNPKPVYELLVEIETQEIEERMNSSERNVQVNKRSDVSDIEKEHESYVREHQSQFNALIHDVQQRAIGKTLIKEELDSQVSLSSDIMDESGNVIGESSLTVEKSLNIAPFHIKEEIIDSDSSSSDSTDIFLRQSMDESKNIEDISFDKKKKSDKAHNLILPSSFGTKGAPTVKIKEDSPSLLDNLSNQELLPVHSPPSSIEDFELGKIQTQLYHKRKSIRRLSNGDKGKQRKN